MVRFDIRSATLEELTCFIQNLGEKPFRGQQIFEWLHKKHAVSFDEMTNLPAALRLKLAEVTAFSPVLIVESQISTDKSTKKFLCQIENYGTIEGGKVLVEAAVMKYHHGLTACLSTQAGCRMGCDFCASAHGGLERNLTAGEIAAQYYALTRVLGERIGNIVLMGVGEPLDNYDNVIKFIRLINHPMGANVGARSITLSTCGLVPEIYALMEEKLQINLAISLHAPNNQLRRRLMPIARSYDLDELIKACKAYTTGGRRVTFEYILIDGINDSTGCAKELCKRLAGINCHINLIAANNVPEKGYNKSNVHTIRNFKEVLEKEGFNVTVRREMGADISGACGQLRNQ
ncbi:MAG: 23S rRNA (adenine(2503)-C(2))-methyltransferase RlmN [Defluviitaleaceae bacterium]|nr:23S rRNA (adenine(2503)-C(2))-methyltransferase RlmN [Defluviitaleaceae bacterium]